VDIRVFNRADAHIFVSIPLLRDHSDYLCITSLRNTAARAAKPMLQPRNDRQMKSSKKKTRIGFRSNQRDIPAKRDS
ncbi:MAG: hypothetical protein R3204_07220, partial [Oceanospirillum sp.]|nr:hypothetical protein [Oceanospirillum sp.]